MDRRAKKSLQVFGLMANFLGLSAFYHNYLSGMFGSEESLFFSLALILAVASPVVLLYAGWLYIKKKRGRGSRKRR
jgi:hypothetical protein